MEGVPILDLCDERGLQLTVFYRWKQEFFENEAAAFQYKGVHHLGSGWGWLLSSVPLPQCRKQKDGRHAIRRGC